MTDFLNILRDDHSNFNKGELSDQLKSANPIALFKQWLEEAVKQQCEEPNAMTISTVDVDGAPSSRVVYLKELEEDGVVFYTNYESQKGQDLAKNPHISASFFWPTLQRQVHLRGIAKKVSAEVSDAYFASRPRESQIGAWASHQSRELSSREELKQRIEELEKKFEGKTIDRPSFWGGYLIQPLSIEFWQGRASRLHDRICFEKVDIQQDSWSVYRKNP